MRLVALLFTRMGVLFSDKCRQKGLVIYSSDYDENMGNVSDTFILWCQKLEGLSEDDLKRGLYALEARQSRMYADGQEMWPPSYAEFIGLCKEPPKEDSCAAHKPFSNTLAIEDETAKKKRFELGEKECGKILSLFD